MKLEELLRGAEVVQHSGEPAVEIRHIACHTRNVHPETLFFALCGSKDDGNKFVAQAVERGAVAVASEAPRPEGLAPNVVWIQVQEARKALATSAANFNRHPADALQVVAVTGTNGKTTVAHLLDSIIKAAGAKTGLFGTIAYHTPLGDYPAPTTTPESLDLQGFLAEIRDAGGKYAVLEASSHSLAMDRLWGCRFHVAVFTNLTRDHLDFHKTFEDYFAAKRRLFEGTGAGRPEWGIVNADDAYGARLAGLAARTLTYGLEGALDVTARKFQLSPEKLSFVAQTPAGKLDVQSALVGKMNVYNILAAVAAAIALGLPKEAMHAGIVALKSVAGRFQRVEMGQPFLVVVDFAHTDDALEKLMLTVREVNPKGRVITMFGCGGDRDRTKRPLMGEVAGRLSDVVVVTSDNPRGEDPLKIISDVVVGLQKAQGKYVIEPDREKAIGLALNEARAGDTVLLAGKGHETSQVFRERTVGWSDAEKACQALQRLGFGT